MAKRCVFTYLTCDTQAGAQPDDLVALAVHFVGDEVGRHVAEAVGDVVEESHGSWRARAWY